MGHSWGVTAIAAVLLATSCFAGQSRDEAAPIALVLSDNVVRAGDVITLEVRSDFAVTEGIATTLQGWHEGRLRPIFTLIKESSTYWPVDDTVQPGIPLVGLRGGTPRRIRIPPDLRPENYRIEDHVSVVDDFTGHAERPKITLTAQLRVVP